MQQNKFSSYVSMAEFMRRLTVGSRQTMYRREKLEPDFPRRRRLGPHRVGYLLEEVERYLSSRPIAAEIPPKGQGKSRIQPAGGRDARIL